MNLPDLADDSVGSEQLTALAARLKRTMSGYIALHARRLSVRDVRELVRICMQNGDERAAEILVRTRGIRDGLKLLAACHNGGMRVIPTNGETQVRLDTRFVPSQHHLGAQKEVTV